MRKLLWFSIGFAAACAAGVYLLTGLWLLGIALFCLLGAVGLYFLKAAPARIAALCLLGCAAGMVWNWGYDVLYLETARSYDGETLRLQLEICDYSFDTGYGVAADGIATLDGKQYNVRLYASEGYVFAPGDVAWGQMQLRFTGGGGAREATYHRGEGLFLLAYPTGEIYVDQASEIPAKYLAASLRKGISDSIRTHFPEDTAAFALALLLGDDSMLSVADDAAFQISGIRHVIAVSGLHVSILFAVVYVLSGRKRLLTALIGIPALILFAAVAGFTPSVVRACVMQGLMILALLLDKEYDPPTALAFAALVMLAVNPMTVTSVSFQLSVGCMVGIFLFSERIRKYLLSEKCLGTAKGSSVRARLTRWFAASVSVTLSAMTVTTPLCAWYFGMVSIIGILTNLLTLWVISTIFYGIMLACLASLVWLPLANAIAWLVSWPVRYVLLVARTLSQIPFGTLYTDSFYTVLWIVAVYVLLGLFLLCKKKRPLLLTGCAVGLLCLSALASWLEPRLDNYRMTVMDVGQGQCILLQSQEDAYLVDCGGDSPQRTAMIALRTLRSQGIFQLDGIILTHFDEDHAGAAQYLMEIMPVDTLYLPDAEPDNPIRNALLEHYREKTQFVRTEKIFALGKGEVTLYPAELGETGNESSMCILFQAENCDILITGDRNTEGEMKLLQQARLPDLEILVAGHHGARSSSGLPLLLQTMPEIAIISVGEGNPHKHPEWSTLHRFEMIGCEVYRTDLQGTIIIRG